MASAHFHHITSNILSENIEMLSCAIYPLRPPSSCLRKYQTLYFARLQKSKANAWVDRVGDRVYKTRVRRYTSSHYHIHPNENQQPSTFYTSTALSFVIITDRSAQRSQTTTCLEWIPLKTSTMLLPRSSSN